LSFAVFLWVLGSALLHATWNAMVKTGGDKLTGMILVVVSNGLMGLVVAAFYPLPGAAVWPWILASGLIRTVYYLALGYAYEHGDLSRVYPIARGAAPLFVLGVGAFVLTDQISGIQVAGILLLGLGILLMARGVFTNGESRRLVPFAVTSAMATAAYSITDGTGARLSGEAISFVAWALAVTAVIYLPIAVALKGADVLRTKRRDWARGSFAGAASYLGYTIVVWAMTQAPIALVAALRETSILFAVLIGWLVFSERMDRGKALAALLIVAGAGLTRF